VLPWYSTRVCEADAAFLEWRPQFSGSTEAGTSADDTANSNSATGIRFIRDLRAFRFRYLLV